MPVTGPNRTRRLIGDTSLNLKRLSETWSEPDVANGLLPAFDSVAKRVQHICDFLNSLKDSKLDESSWQDIKVAVEVCETKAYRMNKIFDEVAQNKDAAMEHYRKVAKGERVEDLMKVILTSLLDLARKPAIRAVCGEQVEEELQKALDEVLALSPSLPEDQDSVYNFGNTGSGSFNVHTGVGTQNNNNGGGSTFNAPIHGLNMRPLDPPQ